MAVTAKEMLQNENGGAFYRDCCSMLRGGADCDKIIVIERKNVYCIMADTGTQYAL